MPSLRERLAGDLIECLINAREDRLIRGVRGMPPGKFLNLSSPRLLFLHFEAI